MTTKELIKELSYKLNRARILNDILKEEIERLKIERKKLIYEMYKQAQNNILDNTNKN